MDNAEALLAELERRGVHVTLGPEGPTAGPARLLTERDVANLRRYRTNIVRLLNERTRRPEPVDRKNANAKEPPAQTKTLSPAESAQLIDDVAETFKSKIIAVGPPTPASAETSDPNQAREEPEPNAVPGSVGDDAPLEPNFTSESDETADDAPSPKVDPPLEITQDEPSPEPQPEAEPPPQTLASDSKVSRSPSSTPSSM
jgi:hypothetical protein